MTTNFENCKKETNSSWSLGSVYVADEECMILGHKVWCSRSCCLKTAMKEPFRATPEAIKACVQYFSSYFGGK